MLSIRFIVLRTQCAIEWITKAAFVAAKLAIICLIFFMTAEIFSRYLLRSSTSWSYELSTMAFGAIIVLGTAGTLRNGQHIRVDFLYGHFSDHRKRLIDGIFYCVFLQPCLFLLSKQLWKLTFEAFQSGETTGYSAWNPPIWPFSLILALGVTVLILQIVSEVLKIFASPESEEAA